MRPDPYPARVSPEPTPEALEELRTLLRRHTKADLTEADLRESYRNLMGYGMVAMDIARRLAREAAEADRPQVESNTSAADGLDGYPATSGGSVQKS